MGAAILIPLVIAGAAAVKDYQDQEDAARYREKLQDELVQRERERALLQSENLQQEARRKQELSAYLRYQEAQLASERRKELAEDQRLEGIFQAKKQQAQLEAASMTNELTSQMHGSAQAYHSKLLPSICNYVKSISDALPVEFKKYKNVAFTGDVLVGKSSLLNTNFDLNLEVGSDHTTMNFQNVYRARNVVFWDTPGQNSDDQLLLDPRAAQLLHAMDLIVIMYTSDLNTVSGLIGLAQALGRPVALVRMKADLIIEAAARGEEPLAHFVAKDQQRFPDWPVFACSAWDPRGTENDRFKRFLLDPAGPSQTARR
jgi:hypothetical protein